MGESSAARIGTLLAAFEDDDRPFAVGWATVELDRAAAELAAALGLAPDTFTPAPDSRILGARCRVALGVPTGDQALVILEPATEGRLAGALARRDEGPWIVWLAGDPDPARPTSEPRAGPFGSERLIVSGPRWGPFRLLAQRAAGTIRS